jgi:hypothetical protein
MVIRRPCEAASRTLPLLLVLFIPIVIGIPHLYQWSHSDIVAHDPVLQHKSIYLNVPFFLIRAGLYFAGWLLIAHLLYRWSGDQDCGDLRAGGRLEAISGPGLIFFGFSVTFMAVDWILSINPHWFSTIFGLLFIAGEALSALAFLICVLVILSSRPPLESVLTHRHLHDVGKLLLALVMVWAYFSFSQLLVIWSGNLPEEIPWYLDRINGHWGIVCTLDFMFHWLIPFSLLLSKDIKRNKKRLIRVAQWMIFAKAFDLFWLIEPNFRGAARNLHFSWGILEYIAVPVALVSFWIAFLCIQLKTRPLVQTNDPHVAEILEAEHAHA